MRRILTCLIVCAVLGTAAPAQADVVTYWNDVVAQALTRAVPARPGPSTILDYAAVHVAMHDAIQAFQGRYETYAGAIRGRVGLAGRSGGHSCTRRAHQPPPWECRRRVRGDEVSGVPRGEWSEYRPIREWSLANRPPLTTSTHVRWREATLCLRRRSSEALTRESGDRRSSAGRLPWPSRWSPRGSRSVLPYTLEHSAQFRTAIPPPDLSSDAYVAAYDEVKALGGAANTVRTTIMRTAEQTEIAYFFSDNTFLYWNRALRDITDARLSDIGESARMFALVNMAMADAVITSWDSKIYLELLEAGNGHSTG